jgi:hypothetical protein
MIFNSILLGYCLGRVVGLLFEIYSTRAKDYQFTYLWCYLVMTFVFAFFTVFSQ